MKVHTWRTVIRICVCLTLPLISCHSETRSQGVFWVTGLSTCSNCMILEVTKFGVLKANSSLLCLSRRLQNSVSVPNASCLLCSHWSVLEIGFLLNPQTLYEISSFVLLSVQAFWHPVQKESHSELPVWSLKEEWNIYLLTLKCDRILQL